MGAYPSRNPGRAVRASSGALVKWDTVVLAALTAVALVGAVIVDVSTGSVPDFLTAAVTTLIGATAGVAVSGPRTVAVADDTIG